jgi:hypothetical protein
MFVSRRRLLQGSLLCAAGMVRPALSQAPSVTPTPDERKRTEQLLADDTLRIMSTPSVANPRYAKGFFLNSGNWWHSGLLDGTTTISVRTRGDFCWSAFTNTRSRVDGMTRSLDLLVWNMVRSVSGWHPERA